MAPLSRRPAVAGTGTATLAVCMLALASVLLLAITGVDAQTCINEQGESVDWWVMLKNSHSSVPSVSAGHAYLYGDAVSHSRPSSFWTNSSTDISDGKSAIGRTLQQIYNGASNAANGYVMYNDELPNGPTSDDFGHTKGQLMWSTAGKGFWLIHSVPKLADSPANGASEYEYPDSGVEYGQSAICVTMDLTGINSVFGQLQYTNPQTYGTQWVSSLAAQLPAGVAFLEQGVVNTGAASHVVNITSIGGKTFTHFAKTTDWGQSIYGSLIGPWYGQSMLAETWQRPYEPPTLPPSSTDAVYSVQALAAPAYASWDGVEWKESEDHSKWAIPTDRTVPLTCIGDINKQLSQYKRSGGLMCVVDSTVHAAYAALITKTDEGSSSSRRGGAVAPTHAARIATE